MLSIIIPCHNEGKTFVQETIDQIRGTIDVSPYEIIVVDDGSDKPLSIRNAKVIRHKTNIGVGAAFDTGVKEALYDNLILMGCDIRFAKNQWASRMLRHIEEHIGSFIASACVQLNQYSRCCNEDLVKGVCSKCGNPSEDNMSIEYRRDKRRLNGATMFLFHDRSCYAEKSPVADDFRSLFDAKWLPIDSNPEGYEIPCILGAFYGVKKSWYNFVDGWAGHRCWGALEPYISLKSWLFGGSCRMAPDVETGHIFKKTGTHGTPAAVQYYNRFLIAHLLFEHPDYFYQFMPDLECTREAARMIGENKEWIKAKRRLYQQRIIVDWKEYCDRFGIDYRNLSDDITPDLIRMEANGIYSRDNAYNRHYTMSPYTKVWEEVSKHIQKDEKVCDIGCGPGQFMEFMLDKGVKEYTGIDISSVAISRACSLLAKRPDQHKATMICTNILNGFALPDKDTYTLVEILEHLNDDLFLIGKIPQGKKVILTVPNYLGGSHVRKFETPEEVIARYQDIIDPAYIQTIPHGSGKIHVLCGTKT